VQILVVDDEPLIRHFLKSRLRALGHSTAEASDGKAAWDIINNQEFDLIISDWIMPEIDGLDLCRLIRQSKEPPYRYVILCTANNQKADFVKGMEAGADDFISKPIDFDDLRLRIRAAERVLTLQKNLASQNESLKAVNDQLEQANLTIHRDLEVASAMQLRMLPRRSPLHPRVALDWLFLPSSFLAGDMLNYFLIENRYLVFYQLDVSGHGLQAALLSVSLNRVLIPDWGSPLFTSKAHSAKAGTLLGPAEVVSELNRRFQMQDDQYFTILYGVYDTKTREVRFCQAGHTSPIYVPAQGKPVQIGTGGFPVGLWPDIEYEETQLVMEKGSRLLLCSDGVTGCRSLNEGYYSQEQLQSLISSVEPDSGLSGILATLHQDLITWCGRDEFPDDISVLGIESR
jgi:phosphoserine phosphatase RsbU/P